MLKINMFYFTSYANQKFDILRQHKIFVIQEQIKDVVTTPDKLTKKGKLFIATKDDLRVIYQVQSDVTRILTFYPVKK